MGSLAIPITSYDSLEKGWFGNKGKVVVVGGCFDLLHRGHVEFLRRACEKGDYLVVALEDDAHIICYKGRRPVHSQGERAENLCGIRYVDHVVLLPPLFKAYETLVERISPYIVAVTSGDPFTTEKSRQAHKAGATLMEVMTSLKDFSTSLLLEKSYTPLAFSGVVLRGKGEAKTLGFPTANISIEEELSPGVYKAYAQLRDVYYQAMCYVAEETPYTLETYLHDFSRDCYGESLRVILHSFVRPPERNLDFSQLKERIKEDARLCFL